MASFIFGGCSSGVHEHYVSPKIEGTASKINLDEVQKAFWESKGKDFNSWMSAFEKRVNEIYDGKEIVSIDATRDNGKLVVTGYINKVNKEGFQPGDEKLFSLEQTGEAVNNEMPYRVAGGDGGTYYQGHHSILDNPIVQYMLLSHMMGGSMWGGRYYTPQPQYVILQHARDSFRTTPQYQQQQTSNNSFFSRFKTNSAGDLQSKTKFGSSFSGTSATSSNRTFGGSSSSVLGSGSSSSSSSSGLGSSWGGRRSSFGSSSPSFGGSFRSRSWGGRRR